MNEKGLLEAKTDQIRIGSGTMWVRKVFVNNHAYAFNKHGLVHGSTHLRLNFDEFKVVVFFLKISQGENSINGNGMIMALIDDLGS